MEDLVFYEEIVKKFQNSKRFTHTLGVAKEAYALGQIFLPEKSDKLRLAGILHDITKEFSVERQLNLCDEYGIIINKNELVPKLLHAKTGCEFARRLLGKEVVDDEIYNAILYHTTGRKDMTLFESLIYLADYIEEGRSFVDCIELRKYFYKEIENATSYAERLEVLASTMILSFDLTIKNLIEEGKSIDYDTVTARSFFLKNKNKISEVF